MTSISKMGVEDGSPYPSSARKAENAERDANRRIQVAENHVQQVERDDEQTLSYVNDQYEKAKISEEAHQEALLESMRAKGYQNLRDLQRSQTEEINRVRKESDARLNNLRNYYRDIKYSVEQNGTQELKDLELKNEQNVETTRKTGIENINELNDDHVKRAANLVSQYETQEMKLKTEQQKELDHRRIAGAAANEIAESKFQEQFEKLNATQKEYLNRIEGNASKKITDIRQDTADKLAAYRTRQSDPFYKMMDFGAHMSENDSGFTLTLKVPEYEQKSFSVSIKGENIVVMGQRRNEELLDLGHGASQGTASYQSYHESIPLTWPVDANRVTKEFKGDTVIIRVPKKNKYAAHEQPRISDKNVNHTADIPRGIEDFFAEKPANSDSKIKTTKSSPGSGPIS